jgi:predicted DNA repair protein MutK
LLILGNGILIMNKLAISTLVATVLTFSSYGLHAAEICKVSMMGRVCFEEGSPEATAAHMKGDAVVEAAAKKKTADNANPKKVAGNSK